MTKRKQKAVPAIEPMPPVPTLHEQAKPLVEFVRVRLTTIINWLALENNAPTLLGGDPFTRNTTNQTWLGEAIDGLGKLEALINASEGAAHGEQDGI